MTITKESITEEKAKKKSSAGTAVEFGAAIENKKECYPQTGEWKVEIPLVDKEVCIGCGTCSKNCPEATIEMKNISDKQKPLIHYEFCKGCGVCANVCPVKAISMNKRG